MKTTNWLGNTTRWLLLALACTAGIHGAPVTADRAQVSTSLTPGGGGKIIVEASGVQAVAPLFFSANANQSVRIGSSEITNEVKLSVRVLQGSADVLTLGLSGDGDVVAVAGEGLRDWSVRQGTGDAAAKRFLDLATGFNERHFTPFVRSGGAHAAARSGGAGQSGRVAGDAR